MEPTEHVLEGGGLHQACVYVVLCATDSFLAVEGEIWDETQPTPRLEGGDRNEQSASSHHLAF